MIHLGEKNIQALILLNNLLLLSLLLIKSCFIGSLLLICRFFWNTTSHQLPPSVITDTVKPFMKCKCIPWQTCWWRVESAPSLYAPKYMNIISVALPKMDRNIEVKAGTKYWSEFVIGGKTIKVTPSDLYAQRGGINDLGPWLNHGLFFSRSWTNRQFCWYGRYELKTSNVNKVSSYN